MPHITEEIWQRLPRLPGDDQALIVSAFKLPGIELYEDEAAAFDEVIDVIGAIRTLRGENSIVPKARITAVILTDGNTDSLDSGREYMMRLAKLETLTVTREFDAPKGTAVTRAGRFEVLIPLEGLVDFDEERRRLEKTIRRISDDIEKVEKKLSNASFVERAPAAVVEKERGKLERMAAERATAEQGLAQLP